MSTLSVLGFERWVNEIRDPAHDYGFWREHALIIHRKIPCYFRRLARGIRPGRKELESVNQPVTIGGVLVRPGDVVMADGDVVVPRERAEEVAKAALPFLDNIARRRYIEKTGENPWQRRPQSN